MATSKAFEIQLGSFVDLLLCKAITVVIYTTVYNFSLEWFVVPGLAMGKVYSNSMLALLNSRIVIVNGRDNRDTLGETYEMESTVQSRDNEDLHRQTRHMPRDPGEGQATVASGSELYHLTNTPLSR